MRVDSKVGSHEQNKSYFCLLLFLVKITNNHVIERMLYYIQATYVDKLKLPVNTIRKAQCTYCRQINKIGRKKCNSHKLKTNGVATGKPLFIRREDDIFGVLIIFTLASYLRLHKCP